MSVTRENKSRYGKVDPLAFLFWVGIPVLFWGSIIVLVYLGTHGYL